MSNEKKSFTLCMSHGTATGRLRKNILFHLLVKHDENNCQTLQTGADFRVIVKSLGTTDKFIA